MRAAFITIGQTPQVDLVPELSALIGPGLDITEFGALDDLSPREIAALRPGPEDGHLATRLIDGSEVVVSKSAVRDRVQEIGRQLEHSFDLSLLLCTGHLPDLSIRGLFFESQTLVDHAVRALSGSANLIGIIQPRPGREKDVSRHLFAGKTLQFRHAAPSRFNRLEEAARELAHADLIVMHCIGYTEAQRRCVARISERPVLLARRLVAAAIRQLV